MPPKKSFAKKVPYSKDRPAKRTKFADDVSKVKVSNTKPSSLPAKVAAKPNSVAKGKQKERAPTPPPNRLSSTKAKSEKQPSTTANIKSTPLSPLPSAFKIVAGSYEKLLYGLEGTVSASSSEDIAFSLKPIFIFPAHVSCVKAVTASPQGGKWLATGSADEIIKVWDLRRRREIGGLMHHEGSVTHLSFPSRSHLLSASEDGTLCLFRARDWSVLRALKGHKGPVNSVAVHPSGKVALSVGKDRTLRMWDLMRGRASGSTKLGVEGELVRWSTSGSLLVVQYQKTIDVYSNDLTRLHTVTHPSRIQDVKFVQRVTSDDEVLLVAAEDKKVTVYDVGADSKIAPKPIAEFVGHENRVKAMDTLRIALPLPSRPSTTILSTVSSDGNIHVYDLFAIPPPPTNGETAGDTEKPSIVPVAIYDSKGSRLTCVTLADGEISGDSMAAGDKRKRSDEEENDGEAEVEWSSEQEDHEEEEEEEEEDEEEEEEEEEGEED